MIAVGLSEPGCSRDNAGYSPTRTRVRLRLSLLSGFGAAAVSSEQSGRWRCSRRAAPARVSVAVLRDNRARPRVSHFAFPPSLTTQLLRLANIDSGPGRLGGTGFPDEAAIAGLTARRGAREPHPLQNLPVVLPQEHGGKCLANGDPVVLSVEHFCPRRRTTSPP